MRSYRLLLAFSKKIIKVKWLCCVLFVLAQPGFAVVNVEGTRVIFNAGEMVSSVNLINSGGEPSLVQLWFDEGDLFMSPENARTPIIAVPPVFRLQPGELRDVKLQLISRNNIPQDKESLYWLNIYQVPPNTIGPANEKRVILPLRLRLKVFVRPANVPRPQQTDGERLQFQIKNSNQQVVIMSNPTPWYMTIAAFESGDVKVDSIMLAPGEKKEITLNKTVKAGEVQYEIINDDGTKWRYRSILRQ